MTVVDSREDLDAARARIEAASAEQLATDLQYWTVAVLDAGAEHGELAARQAGVMARYEEAQRWTSLIATELRKRRDARVGPQSTTES